MFGFTQHAAAVGMNDELAQEFERVRLMQMFGWTPSQVDEISKYEMSLIFDVIQAEQHYNPKLMWFP